MTHTIFGPLPFTPRFVHLPIVDSTNEFAKRMVASGEVSHGTVIMADYQQEGRGMMGNRWEGEPAENLYFTLYLQTKVPVERQFDLSMSFALAIHQTISSFIPGVKIKWPNDIYHGRHKLAGILIENAISASMINACISGIGINVNQTVFSGLETATSMALLSGKRYNLPEIVDKLCQEINSVLSRASESSTSIKEAYYREMLFLGEYVNFEAAGKRFKAKVNGIDEWGRLILEEGDALKAYALKEIKWIF